MFNRKKKRLLKKRLKRIAIVGAPIALLCLISYASITSLLHASESTFAFEQFHENTGSTSENGKPGSVKGNNMGSNSEDVTVITNHDEVELDTNPASITVLVNKELSLPADYIPDDLVVPNVPFSISYYDEKKLLRQNAADALEDLFQGATDANMSLTAVSGYRSYDRQYEIFTSNIKSKGLEHTLEYSAIPGYSEHQTGLSIDVSSKSVNNRLDASLAGCGDGKWLAEHAYEYGFIIRYPEDKVDITGYSYEPWHIRYVGKALAKYLYENNLSLEEYYNFIPNEDYAGITLDTLVSEYNIKMADMVVPTRVPTKIPVQVVDNSDTKEEETKEESTDTVDTDKPSKGDGQTVDEQTVDDGKGSGETGGGTKGNGGSHNGGGSTHVTPTITPPVEDPDPQTSESTETDTAEEETGNSDTLTPTPSVIPE